MNYTDEDLDVFIERIKFGDCVLFLGPDLFRDAKQESLYRNYSLSKCRQMEARQIEFDSTQEQNLNYTVNRYIDGLNEHISAMLIKPDQLMEKRNFSEFIKKNLSVKQLYDKLALFPFQLVINTNPDRTIYDSFSEKLGEDRCCFWYYDFNRQDNEQVAESHLPLEITPDKTVIYNVYGYDAPASTPSILLGETDYLEFVRKVNMPQNGLPVSIRNFIRNNRICLFIGFQHESWTLKILLQALGFSEQTRNNFTFPADRWLPHVEHFYRGSFNFSFRHPGAEVFVDKLYQRFMQNAVPVPSATRLVQLVFICCTASADGDDYRKDLRVRDKIAKQLKPKQLEGKISIWADDIAGGEHKVEVRNERYAAADIFIVIGSDLLYDEKVHANFTHACQLLKQDPGKRIIPVFARHFLLEQVKEIPHGDWIPRNAAGPVPVLDEGRDEDKTITEACSRILEIIDQVSKEVSDDGKD